MGAMAGDRSEPGWKFFRLAQSPSGFPGFQEAVLDDVLGLFSILQNAVGDRKKGAALSPDDHFKGFAIAADGRSKDLIFSGIHRVDLKPRRAK